jgi:hypothetical protein
VDLYFVGVARGVWLQNIDSRDLVGKMSGCNILRGFERYSVLGNQFPVASSKCKRLRGAQPRLFNSLYFYFSEWGRKSCSEFSSCMLLVLGGLRRFPDVQGLDRIFVVR